MGRDEYGKKEINKGKIRDGATELPCDISESSVENLWRVVKKSPQDLWNDFASLKKQREIEQCNSMGGRSTQSYKTCQPIFVAVKAHGNCRHALSMPSIERSLKGRCKMSSTIRKQRWSCALRSSLLNTTLVSKQEHRTRRKSAYSQRTESLLGCMTVAAQMY